MTKQTTPVVSYKVEIWSLGIMSLVILVCAIIASCFYHDEKEKRIASEEKAKRYEVLQPLIKKGVDTETLQKVNEALEKTKLKSIYIK